MNIFIILVILSFLSFINGHKKDENSTEMVHFIRNETSSFIFVLENWLNKHMNNNMGNYTLKDYHFHYKNKNKKVNDNTIGLQIQCIKEFHLKSFFRVIKPFLLYPYSSIFSINDAKSIIWHPSKDCLEEVNTENKYFNHKNIMINFPNPNIIHSISEMNGGSGVQFIMQCNKKQLIKGAISSAGSIFKKPFSNQTMYFGGGGFHLNMYNDTVNVAYIAIEAFNNITILNLTSSKKLYEEKNIIKNIRQEVYSCALNNSLNIVGGGGGGWNKKVDIISNINNKNETIYTYNDAFGYGFDFVLIQSDKNATNETASSFNHSSLQPNNKYLKKLRPYKNNIIHHDLNMSIGKIVKTSKEIHSALRMETLMYKNNSSLKADKITEYFYEASKACLNNNDTTKENCIFQKLQRNFDSKKYLWQKIFSDIKFNQKFSNIYKEPDSSINKVKSFIVTKKASYGYYYWNFLLSIGLIVTFFIGYDVYIRRRGYENIPSVLHQ